MNIEPNSHSNSQPELNAGGLTTGDLKFDDLQWEIERYLLDDPTLDREAFEQRMLNDVSLAEQVATAVAHMQLIAEAVDSTSTHRVTKATPTAPAVLTGRTAFDQWIYRSSILASAAALLIAVTAWQYRSHKDDDQLARIADNWSAFENLTTEEALGLVLASESHSLDVLHDDALQGEPNDSAAIEQSDWLVEAAQEFYLASNEGAAG